MTDHRNVGHLVDHGVAVDALATTTRAAVLTVIEQVAERHRGIAVDSGVSDCHTELDDTHNPFRNKGIESINPRSTRSDPGSTRLLSQIEVASAG
jgi:hypothetical protein